MGEFRRFFATEIIDNTILLSGEQHHHLSKVLRLKTGEEVVVNIKSSPNDNYHCKISKISEFQTTLIIDSVISSNAESVADITLYQCVIKGDKMELVLQKAVELGVNRIVPIHSSFTVAKADGKEERYNKITMEASKQCGRAKHIEVTSPLTFKQMLMKLDSHELVVFCNEKEQKQTILSLMKGNSSTNIGVVIGSEGGFSGVEIEQLSSCINVVSVTLGRRILRAETATIAALTLIECSVSEAH